MKLSICHVLAAISSLVLCVAGHAQLTTLAYDGFNYSAGSLAGQNGGTGWSTPWTNEYTSGVSLQVSASGMSYAGLTTSGGSAVWGPGGNNISEDLRTLPLVNSGVVYIQFLSQLASSSGGGTPNLRLFTNGVLTGGFGGNGGTYGAKMSILDNTLTAASDGSSSSANNLSSLNMVIARIDYQNHLTQLWVNPDLSTFDYFNPTTPAASYAGLAPVFNSLAFYTRSPGQVDEFKIMAISVPEPASAYFFLLGAGGLFYGWRRRD